MLRVVYQGRDPELKLERNKSKLKLSDWGGDLLSKMQPVAEQLNIAHGNQHYLEALNAMQSALLDSSITPSASMLTEMQDNNETYYRMAMRKAQEHREFFLSGELDTAITEHYRHLAAVSQKQQASEEKNDQLSFDKYLADYWKSSKTTQ